MRGLRNGFRVFGCFFGNMWFCIKLIIYILLVVFLFFLYKFVIEIFRVFVKRVV